MLLLVLLSTWESLVSVVEFHWLLCHLERKPLMGKPNHLY